VLRLFCLILSLNVVVPAAVQGQQLTVTLLGTGCPPAVMNRFGPSTLVEAGGQKFLFDAGRGALQRLVQLDIPWQAIQGVFLTHLHSDHVVGFPDLWLTGWLICAGPHCAASGVGADWHRRHDVSPSTGVQVRHRCPH
jgi:ribonuclease Z